MDVPEYSVENVSSVVYVGFRKDAFSSFSSLSNRNLLVTPIDTSASCLALFTADAAFSGADGHDLRPYMGQGCLERIVG